MEKRRRSIRLKDYNYTDDGAYFITICSHQKACLFGNVIDDGVWLSQFGSIALNKWEKTASLREHVILDAFVVMPNHVHGIIFIQQTQSVGAWRTT